MGDICKGFGVHITLTINGICTFTAWAGNSTVWAIWGRQEEWCPLGWASRDGEILWWRALPGREVSQENQEGNISSDGEPALGWSRNRAQYCSGDAQKDSACPPGDHISRRCPSQKCSYIWDRLSECCPQKNPEPKVSAPSRSPRAEAATCWESPVLSS